MTNLKKARETGKTADFIKEHEADPPAARSANQPPFALQSLWQCRAMEMEPIRE